MSNNSRPDAPLRQPSLSRLGIVGLGLVGGSIAHAARARIPDVHIYGVDREMIVNVAKDEQIINDGAEPHAAIEALKSCEVVVLCLPVNGIIEFLDSHGSDLANGPVITDTGSTKSLIGQKADELDLFRFIGGHPMAGKAEGGLAHADPELLKGATWFLCPTQKTDPDAALLLRQLIRDLEAQPLEISAEDHDRAVAFTSHFPHILVNLLAETIMDEGVLDAAGGTLHNVLRVAGAPFNVWGDTLKTNQEAILESMKRFNEKLSTLADELEDPSRLKELFGRGRICRERLRGDGPS